MKYLQYVFNYKAWVYLKAHFPSPGLRFPFLKFLDPPLLRKLKNIYKNIDVLIQMNKTVIFLTEKHFYFCPFTKIQIYNQIKDVRKMGKKSWWCWLVRKKHLKNCCWKFNLHCRNEVICRPSLVVLHRNSQHVGWSCRCLLRF